MSQLEGWKTNFSYHALLRLSERTSMTPELLGSILDKKEVIFLGTALGNSRASRLFFSKDDDKFFIAIQDMETDM